VLDEGDPLVGVVERVVGGVAEGTAAEVDAVSPPLVLVQAATTRAEQTALTTVTARIFSSLPADPYRSVPSGPVVTRSRRP